MVDHYKKIKLPRLIYILSMLLILFSFIQPSYGLNEFGKCNIAVITSEQQQKDLNISWAFVDNKLNININGNEHKNIEGYAILNTPGGDSIISDFPLIWLPGLTDMSDQSDASKMRYLKFRKSSIKEKDGTRKNVMELNIVTSTGIIDDKNKEGKSRKYKVLANQSQCRIRYERDGGTLYVDNLDGIDMANYTVTKWASSLGPYTIPPQLANQSKVPPENIANFIPKKPKGVCFFDIDGTLNQNFNNDKNQQVIWSCLDRGFLVGIITASKRTPEHTCKEAYVSQDLCSLIKINNRYMYNSALIRSGEGNSDILGKYLKAPGLRKAYQAHYWRNKYYPAMPDECVVLFDDDKNYLKHYQQYGNAEFNLRPTDGVIDKNNHNFGYFLTNLAEGAKELSHVELIPAKDTLSSQNVAAEVSRLVSNGCNTEIPAAKIESDRPDGGLEEKAKDPKD